MGNDRKILNVQESEILSVSKLTEYIKQRLENDSELINIWVRGEISNYTKSDRGHMYFTLKDETSQIRCAMFNRRASSLEFEIEHGMKILVFSSISIYEKNGYYQLVVSEIQLDGLGALHQRFLQLKEKLEKEGLFSREFKKPLPRFPKTIGIITSSTGAAIKDLISNLTRRFPVNIKYKPTLVQGIGAAEDIARSIKLLNRIKGIDIIILGRGGGSLEDLWCFNEEIVARAIFESEIPIISAVGHETDFTIADFVADCRAPTPSTAAEIAVPDKNELLRNIKHLRDKILTQAKRILDLRTQCLNFVKDRPIFKRPVDFINQYLQQIDELMLRSERAIFNFLELKGKSLEGLVSTFHSLNPKEVLGRGYSIAMNKGKIIKTSEDVEVNDLIEIILYEGEIKSKVVGAKKHDK